MGKDGDIGLRGIGALEGLKAASTFLCFMLLRYFDASMLLRCANIVRRCCALPRSVCTSSLGELGSGYARSVNH